MKHTPILLAALAATATLAPTALADETCLDALGQAYACAFEHDTGPIQSKGAYVMLADGTFAAVSQNEGSGFFGDTWTADAFVFVPGEERFVVLVVAFNDRFPTDGVYEDGGVYAGTWSYAGGPAADAWASYGDSDWDGQPDVESVEYGVGLLP